MTELRTITLDRIAGEAVDYVAEASPLEPTRCRPRIVCEAVQGALYIVDGFHRVAGLIRWAQEEGLDLGAVEVRVIVCDDDELIRAAAEPGEGQDEALEAIYDSIED